MSKKEKELKKDIREKLETIEKETEDMNKDIKFSSDKKELKEHLAMIKEAMERDHKKLGPQMELFMFDETAPGMPYWLPRGWKMYNALIDYWREVHERHGYTEISAPVFFLVEVRTDP